MFHFPDSDTGYYDTEERFYELDALHEAAAERAYLAELEASHDGGAREIPVPAGPDYRQIAVDLARARVPSAAPDEIDRETGCTAAEMARESASPVEHEICRIVTPDTTIFEGKVA